MSRFKGTSLCQSSVPRLLYVHVRRAYGTRSSASCTPQNGSLGLRGVEAGFYGRQGQC